MPMNASFRAWTNDFVLPLPYLYGGAAGAESCGMCSGLQRPGLGAIFYIYIARACTHAFLGTGAVELIVGVVVR